jgi:predicted branched-subunit amino acid permease
VNRANDRASTPHHGVSSEVTDHLRGSGRRIVGEALAVGLATGAYGISFGAISVTSGLDVWQTCALSLLVFTGASQFALVGVLASGGSAPAAAGTALLLGVRNGLYGLRLAPLLAWRGVRRALGAHLLIDESTAMAVNRDTTADARLGFVATGLSVFVLWNLATLGGALAGEQLGDPRTYGLDAAVGGAFLALLWPRLSGGLARAVAVLAAAVALGLVPLVTPGLPVLAAASVALLGLLPRRVPRSERTGGPR